MNSERISIVIVNYNSPHLIENCIKSIYAKMDKSSFEILIVDNMSVDQSLEQLQLSHPEIRVIFLRENMGFGFAANIGVRNAIYNTVLLLNSDVVVGEFCLNSILKNMQRLEKKSIWGPKILWSNGEIQDSHSRSYNFVRFILRFTVLSYFASLLDIGKSELVPVDGYPDLFETEVLYAAVLFFNREYFLQIGGFSNAYFMYFEDIELSDRIRGNGGSLFFDNNSVFFHEGRGSSSILSFNQNFTVGKYTYSQEKFGFLGLFIIRSLDLLPKILQKVRI